MFIKIGITLLLLCLFTACSSDPANKEQDKKGNEITHKIAQKGIAAIEEPLQKAQMAAQELEKHNQELNRQATQQDNN